MSAKREAAKSYIKTLVIVGAFLVMTAAIVLFLTDYNRRNHFSGNNPQYDDGKMADDLELLSSGQYEAVLLSMHSTFPFKEEDFSHYLGLNTFVASHAVLNTEELSQYLECVFGSSGSVSRLYICPDPELLWVTAHLDSDTWEQNLTEDFYSHIKAHPEISFSILLPYPYISYWVELDTEKLESLLARYHILTSELYAYPNVRVFFPGAENWLTLNPGNYTDTLFDANEIITQSIFLHTFCDGEYEITPENEASYWNSLRETIAGEKSSPACYADLSDWCLVFFGDSVIGNYSGSFSIPGYVNGLSGASVYNYAVGGTPASYNGQDIASFPVVLDRFLTEDVSPSEDGFCFTPEDASGEELGDKKLCFIINYGFNDYFNGAPIENPRDPYDIRTFKGSLRSCILKLQDKFPGSCQIIMTPTHTQHFSYGMEINGEKGDILPAYINASAEIAQETGAFFLNNYEFLATEQDMNKYLADGCHPNENGRLLLGDRIVRFIDTELQIH